MFLDAPMNASGRGATESVAEWRQFETACATTRRHYRQEFVFSACFAKRHHNAPFRTRLADAPCRLGVSFCLLSARNALAAALAALAAAPKEPTVEEGHHCSGLFVSWFRFLVSAKARLDAAEPSKTGRVGHHKDMVHAHASLKGS